MDQSSLIWPRLARPGAWLHSPKLLPWQKKAVVRMKRLVPRDGSLWILSSGTQAADEVKAIGLRPEALLVSAAAVNRHLRATAEDHWMLALPLFHVGGLGVMARSFLSGSRVSALAAWNARAFVNELRTRECTLSSLVPTQVHDLVIAGLTAPKSLRAVVVGGAALAPELYLQARALGWPLLPSYGLTECSSQVATASLSSLSEGQFPRLCILPHIRVGLKANRIWLQSSACAHLVARGRADGGFSLEDPLRRGWMPTEDLGELSDGRYLQLLGRGDDVVKVLGELVPLAQVEHEARKFLSARGLNGDLSIVPVSGGREGQRLVLVTDSGDSLRAWEEGLSELNARLPGPMRMKQLCWVVKIPRGELGKVKKAALRDWIGL